MAKKLVTEALKVANSQENVREVGENAGKRVGEYLKSVGLPVGNPWCAAFVYWCIEQAAEKLHQPNPFVRTAGCAVMDSWADRNDIRMGRPEVGDVFLRRGVVDGVFRACHTGFVTAVNGVIFKTIEGNTNLDGGREGIGVFRHSRTNSDRYSFVRWGSLIGEDQEDKSQEFYHLFLSGKEICQMPVEEGRSLCPVRLWGERLGFDVQWNDEQQVFLFDGREVVTEAVILEDGKAYAPIRDLVKAAGLQMKVDVPSHKVEVSRIL